MASSKMRPSQALHISINGRHVCTAAVRTGSVIASVISYSVDCGVGKERVSHVSVHGADTDSKQCLSWPAHLIRLGDVITIRVTESDDADAPEASASLPAG
jgi:hypothetical protein